jgi:DNA primase
MRRQHHTCEDPDRMRYGIRRAISVLKERVKILDVADYHGAGKGGWHRVGERWIRRCVLPGHEDRTPSFMCYPDGRFQCFGCGVSGDAIDLEKLCGSHAETWTAVVEISQRYNVPLPERPKSWFRRQERQRSVRERINSARAEVLRRRLFRITILPLIKATTPDENEYRDEVRRAWADFQDVPVGDLLDRCDHLGGV